MRRHFSSPIPFPAGGRPGPEAGSTVLEVVSALAIAGILFSSLHLLVGTGIMARLKASSWMSNQQAGHLAADWIADRARMAGFRVNPADPILRCRDKVAAEDPAYRPTASRLYINADIDNAADKIPETVGFDVRSGVIWVSIMKCTAGAPTAEAALTSPAVVVEALTFGYYDAAGGAVTALGNPTAIRTIRIVEVTVRVRAGAGAQAPTTQTWRTRVSFRNP